MTIKEKMLVDKVIKRYLDVRLYFQIDLYSKEYIFTTTPVNFDDLPESILKMYNLDQLTSNTLTEYGVCRLIN